MHAKSVVKLFQAYVQVHFPGKPTMIDAVSSMMMHLIDTRGGGSHKYIPAEKLNEDLGLEQGSGVYGYISMHDNSCILNVCGGRLAVWSGNKADKAEWVE